MDTLPARAESRLRSRAARIRRELEKGRGSRRSGAVGGRGAREEDPAARRRRAIGACGVARRARDHRDSDGPWIHGIDCEPKLRETRAERTRSVEGSPRLAGRVAVRHRSHRRCVGGRHVRMQVRSRRAGEEGDQDEPSKRAPRHPGTCHGSLRHSGSPACHDRAAYRSPSASAKSGGRAAGDIRSGARPRDRTSAARSSRWS